MTEILPAEKAKVQGAVGAKIKASTDLTMGADGYSDRAGHSVYQCTAIFNDRTVEMLSVDNVSDESHTGQWVAGEYHNYVLPVSPDAWLLPGF